MAKKCFYGVSEYRLNKKRRFVQRDEDLFSTLNEAKGFAERRHDPKGRFGEPSKTSIRKVCHIRDKVGRLISEKQIGKVKWMK